MDLLTRFEQFIEKEQLFNKTNHLLLAVSGGVDSMVLCELCRRAGYRFTLAHCNFQLRGEESMRDEAFVLAYAHKHNLPVLIERFDTNVYAETQGVSTQVAARELRYNWFRQIENVDYILTAHHADDNIETLLMNFFKGTGISGLHGILPKQAKLVRPLLPVSKKDILDFATVYTISYVEDSSNVSDKYTRNYFRNQLIPAIENVYPSVRENMQNNIQRFIEVEELYKQAVDLHKKKLLEYKRHEVHIPVLKLMKVKPLGSVLYEIMKEYNFTPNQLPDIIQLLGSASGKLIASPTHRIIKNRNWLIISPFHPTETAHFVIERADDVVLFNGKKLLLDVVSSKQSINASPQIAQVDASQIEYPLLLRKWKTGDYFYPLGMKKKKKLNRFFIDQKLSLTEKENCWVLEMNKKIVWVVGMRIDDRFKVRPSTTEVLSISLEED